MSMHAAAAPAHRGVATEANRQHARFAEYDAYRRASAGMLVDSLDFDNWLRQQEAAEYRDDWAKHPEYPAFLAWMRETKGGARGSLNFPENFKLWLNGGRW